MAVAPATIAIAGRVAVVPIRAIPTPKPVTRAGPSSPVKSAKSYLVKPGLLA